MTSELRLAEEGRYRLGFLAISRFSVSNMAVRSATLHARVRDLDPGGRLIHRTRKYRRWQSVERGAPSIFVRMMSRDLLDSFLGLPRT